MDKLMGVDAEYTQEKLNELQAAWQSARSKASNAKNLWKQLEHEEEKARDAFDRFMRGANAMLQKQISDREKSNG